MTKNTRNSIVFDASDIEELRLDNKIRYLALVDCYANYERLSSVRLIWLSRRRRFDLQKIVLLPT